MFSPRPLGVEIKQREIRMTGKAASLQNTGALRKKENPKEEEGDEEMK